MYGLALTAILVVMGGVIAYIGDKLGTKVGKKKLTMFGLRPKHTSIIVTIVTGIMITASTIGVLALTSRDVRTALFGMEALKTELATLSRDVTEKNVELAASRTALEAKIAEYTALTARVKESTEQLTRIKEELAEVAEERDLAARELQRVQRDYGLARHDLDKSKQEIGRLQTVKKELDARLTELNSAKSALEQDVGRLNQLAANLKKGIEFVREGAIIYRAGEVVHTAVVKGGQPAAATEKDLTGVIYQSNRSITNKLNLSDKDLEVLWIARKDFEQAVALVAGTPGEIIVRLTSAGNTVYGEPVIGRIDLFPNRLIYTQGAVVFSQEVNAGVNKKQAEEAVLTFLQKVNAEAVKHGVLPDPLQGTVGVMSGAQLFDTINKVNRYSGKVELTAITKADIYTVGPLSVEIRVRGIR